MCGDLSDSKHVVHLGVCRSVSSFRCPLNALLFAQFHFRSPNVLRNDLFIVPHVEDSPAFQYCRLQGMQVSIFRVCVWCVVCVCACVSVWLFSCLTFIVCRICWHVWSDVPTRVTSFRLTSSCASMFHCLHLHPIYQLLFGANLHSASTKQRKL